jgi:recombination protein RecR
MEVGALSELIKIIAKLPGLGTRSARRIVLHMLKNPDKTMQPLIRLLTQVSQEIKICEACGNVDIKSPCHICTDHKRDSSLVCVVEDITDLWSLERSKSFQGIYHVLGGTLSALDGITPAKLNLESLRSRVANSNIQEVIIATNATLDGQTTSFYIADMLKPFSIKSTRLAYGIPVGAELDYMDEGTLNLALKMRQEF